MNTQPVTVEQLARLYEAARQANSAYDAARKQFKRQQKAKNKDAQLTTMIRFYLDAQTTH